MLTKLLLKRTGPETLHGTRRRVLTQTCPLPSISNQSIFHHIHARRRLIHRGRGRDDNSEMLLPSPVRIRPPCVQTGLGCKLVAPTEVGAKGTTSTLCWAQGRRDRPMEELTFAAQLSSHAEAVPSHLANNHHHPPCLNRVKGVQESVVTATGLSIRQQTQGSNAFVPRAESHSVTGVTIPAAYVA